MRVLDADCISVAAGFEAGLQNAWSPFESVRPERKAAGTEVEGTSIGFAFARHAQRERIRDTKDFN
ncbi:MAG TPA: hypothetical protein VGH81_04745 [Rudaea sp.]|jgi:hypothetical protein